MASLQCVSFSRNGEYFASATPDGRLKIWETRSGILKQEYTPSFHLSELFTSMAWGPGKWSADTAKKKKKRKSEGSGLVDLELVAMGTAPGSVFLYSVAKGDIQTKMDGGHSGTVNGLCWDEENNELYSCSNDQHIVVWNVVTGGMKSKWKGGKRGISSILLLPGRRLLSASKLIKLWDLEKCAVIQTFTGHASDVFQLLPVYVAAQVDYFVSAAVGERFISAWNIHKGPDSFVSFSVTDEPVSVDVSQSRRQEEPLVMGAVTRDGLLHIFEHQLNGSCKKPLKARVILQIVPAEKKSEKCLPIPILGAHVCSDVEGNVLVVYGNLLRLAFEKIAYRSCKPITHLAREDPNDAVSKLEQKFTKLKTPEMPEDVKNLAPGFMAPSIAGITDVGKSKKRKGEELKSKEQLPMEERLNALSVDRPSEYATLPPKADNLSMLLVQGLHSNDKTIIQTVLHRNEDELIRNTVKRLPLKGIMPLLKELKLLMHSKGTTNHAYVKWVRSILQKHTSYIISCPDMKDILSPMFALLEARTALFPQMSQLRGKLNLMLGQIADREDAKPDVTSEALLVYQDESSDEASDLMDDLVPPSESEDHWDEISVEEQSEDNEDSEDDNGQDWNEGMDMDDANTQGGRDVDTGNG